MGDSSSVGAVLFWGFGCRSLGLKRTETLPFAGVLNFISQTSILRPGPVLTFGSRAVILSFKPEFKALG